MNKPVKNLARTSGARLFLVDDEPLVRRGLTQLIEMHPDLVVCGDAAGGGATLKRIRRLQPDLAILDLRLESGSGLDLIRQLHHDCPKLRILVFTMHDEVLHAERALQAGAHGYVTKEDGSDKAIEAIYTLLDGKPYLSANVAAKLAAKTAGGAPPAAA